MIFRQFFEPRLAQFSFLAGCQGTGQAIVVDPLRRIGQYIEAADAAGLRITAVAETHIHADFASGAPALARRTGATLYVSGEGGLEWQYAFANHAGVRSLKHGDAFNVGQLRFEAVHTPGHTPEHLVYLVADGSVSPHTLGALTGDFLFAGDVGRPDLLEKAVGQLGSAESSARRLYESLRAFAAQPDRLLVWPGHGAGSACGKKLGGMPVTSLGYEKLTNWAWQAGDEQAFVNAVLADQPDPPRYFAEMKRLNRCGAPAVRGGSRLRQLAAGDIDALVTVHAEFIDVRPDATTSGFLPGSLALPLTSQFLTWAGSVLRYGMPVYVVATDQHEAAEAADALSLIAIDEIRGWIAASAVEEYRHLGGELEHVIDIELPAALERQAAGHVLLDVRTTAEWNSGRMAQAVHAPLARLVDNVRELDRDMPLVVYCQAGARSRVAATALRRVGFTHVANLSGGFDACSATPAVIGATPS